MDVGGRENYAIVFPELSKRKALKKKGGPFKDWKVRKKLEQIIICSWYAKEPQLASAGSEYLRKVKQAF